MPPVSLEKWMWLTFKFDTNPGIFHLLFPSNVSASSCVLIPRNVDFKNKHLIFPLYENTLNTKKALSYEIVGGDIYKVR